IRFPTYALSGLVVLLAVMTGMRGTIQDGLLNRYMEREILNLQPQLQEVETTRNRSQRIAERLELLDGVSYTAALPLEILSELTRLLPDDVWLQQMRYAGDSLTLTGNAASASGLLQLLARSEYFDSPRFLSAINPTPDGTELFRIEVRLRTGTP
ncbi:MAG: PilN domain-containing protein, partial [Acidobacteria bacterium]|nr:PilN domain-containing protein [Acidobacteriota bacterium]